MVPKEIQTSTGSKDVQLEYKGHKKEYITQISNLSTLTSELYEIYIVYIHIFLRIRMITVE